MKAFEAPAHNRAEIEAVISALAREPASGVIPIPDFFTVVHRDLIIALSARYRLPATYGFRFFVADGGLVSYGVDLSDMQRRAATYVDRILKGASPPTYRSSYRLSSSWSSTSQPRRRSASTCRSRCSPALTR